ncbi:MAG: cytochrome P450 [Acidimicrobiia bacterium]|nr:cytochrome P450 [Acidimicrobiia bacterium]
MVLTVDDLQFNDPEFIADPYPRLNQLREQAPIFWHAPTGQWMLTRFADVQDTLRDRRLGRVYDHRFSHADFGQPEPDGRWAEFHQHERWSLLSLEPPDHTRLRGLVSRAFTPRSVTQLLPETTAISDRLFDQCRQAGTFDLLVDYAQPFSVAVICSLLGVPDSDTRMLLDWSHAIVKMYELSSSQDQKVAANTAAREFIGYTRELMGVKRRQPDDKLLSGLLTVSDGSDRLTDDEIVSTTMVLLEAGHEATVNAFGNGVRALMKHRDQWQRLLDGDVAAQDGIEEMIRWDGPSQFFHRWVLEPGIVIAGQALEVGDRVGMLFGAAERDPRRFDDPDRFDIGRADSGHIGFGGGLHFCVGAALARQELMVSLDRLVKRFPDLELAEEPSYHQTFVIRGLTGLRVSPTS